MSIVTRSAADLRAELTAVRPAGDEAEPAHLLATALLGFAAEPGDGVLGRLIAATGAVAAADSLLAGVDAAGLVELVAAAGEALDEREAATGIERWRPRLDHALFVRSLAQAARVGARLLVPGDRLWPVAVDELAQHAPITLWVRGRGEALIEAPSIALVGARAATSYGEHVALESAAGLVDRGFTVVSGGAYGIDGMAHRSAIASHGTTVAFLAGGVDRFYPLGHERLLTRIADTGAVVSELACGAAPTKWRFLQRNRLIAAASDATVVLEAGMRSGSLNTAGHAAALGRPLGAVPGPVTSPASAGCHRLLREYDAVCVVDAEQMAELAAGEPRGSAAVRVGAAEVDDLASRAAGGTDTMDPERLRVLDAMSTRSRREVDDIARRAGMPVTAVMGVLAVLESHGTVVFRGDGWLRRRSA
ncbi:DNA-protecting protein DprA [Agromyces tardus]|uniref:DNA-protecting protein DprA n=1 Tax=Agromyces tardus TaxID=2583849 RepID=A0A3M7ZYR7_9MICO|nr:DNA-processing protein DprA [Agromyces tardus]RNB44149.1 DNA-protecting protein DprA [Agromyces tardus]